MSSTPQPAPQIIGAAADNANPERRSVAYSSLRRVSLLAELSDTELIDVARVLQTRQFFRHDIIIKKHSQPDSLLFLLSGKAQVMDISDDGREVGIRILGQGEFFGEISLINGCPRTAYVVALGNATVGFLPRTTALHLFAHSPSVARRMLSILANKIHRDTEFRTLLSIQDTQKRIVALLMQLRQPNLNGAQIIENIPTHQQIANMINTSRETVTRTLLTLSKQGVIHKDGRNLVISNLAHLEKLIRS